MKLTCQLIIGALFVIGFLATVHKDIHGEKAKEPKGFRAVCITLVVFGLLSLAYWKAGLLSELLPK